MGVLGLSSMVRDRSVNRWGCSMGCATMAVYGVRRNDGCTAAVVWVRTDGCTGAVLVWVRDGCRLVWVRDGCTGAVVWDVCATMGVLGLWYGCAMGVGWGCGMGA
eukprot:916019-Pyramimonas_sp.AAC.1